MPGKRAHSKTDKYEEGDRTPLNVGLSGPANGMQPGVLGGPIGGLMSPMDSNQPYLPGGNSMNKLKGMPNIPGSINQ